jgi:hypothetical protein
VLIQEILGKGLRVATALFEERSDEFVFECIEMIETIKISVIAPTAETVDVAEIETMAITGGAGRREAIEKKMKAPTHWPHLKKAISNVVE